MQTRDEKKRPLERYYYIDIERALGGPANYEEAIIGVDADKTQRKNFGRDIVLDLRTAEKEYENFYFPCSQILNSDAWEEGLNAHDAAKFSRYMQFRKSVLGEFRNYDVPVIELKKDNKKEAVCLVFEKVNTRNSAAYKGINVLIQRNGAKYFFWKSTIRDLDETDREECKLDIHHIFPQDWCIKSGIEPKRFNSILNKTPISYKANRMIGGKAPSDYLEQLQGHKTVVLADEGMDAILRTHYMDPVPLRGNDYPGFIEARRKLFIAEIAKVMGKPVVDTGEAIADDESDEEA